MSNNESNVQNIPNVPKKKTNKKLIFILVGGFLLFIILSFFALSLFRGLLSTLFWGQELSQSEVKKISVAALEKMYGGEYSVKRYYEIEGRCFDASCQTGPGGIVLKDNSSNKEYDLRLYYSTEKEYDISMHSDSCEYDISLKIGWANFWEKDIIDNIESSCEE